MASRGLGSAGLGTYLGSPDDQERANTLRGASECWRQHRKAPRITRQTAPPNSAFFPRFSSNIQIQMNALLKIVETRLVSDFTSTLFQTGNTVRKSN